MQTNPLWKCFFYSSVFFPQPNLLPVALIWRTRSFVTAVRVPVVKVGGWAGATDRRVARLRVQGGDADGPDLLHHGQRFEKPRNGAGRYMHALHWPVDMQASTG
jgi:hypothetical protein